MRANLVRNRTVMTGVALGAGLLAVAGCSSSSDNSNSGGSTPTTASGSVPGPPSGSTTITAPEPDGSATYSRYSTSQTPASVVSYYNGALKSAGFNITSTAAAGGGWQQYGGSGGGVSANNGSTYVEVNAGGSKQGATYFEVCSGGSSAAVDSCQGNNHGNSNQS